MQRDEKAISPEAKMPELNPMTAAKAVPALARTPAEKVVPALAATPAEKAVPALARTAVERWVAGDSPPTSRPGGRTGRPSDLTPAGPALRGWP